ncbi:MAG: hypothetical protein JSR41_12020 [Proteobacteria bacterium]|nr:hypothetical protein [Pseudomonadota bacterium]
MLPNGYVACSAIAIVGLLVCTVGRDEDGASMRWEWALMCVVCAVLSFDVLSARISSDAPASPGPGTATQVARR